MRAAGHAAQIGRKKMRTILQSEILKGENYLGEKGIYGRTILK
jgi:hypothetical protein